jgi:glycosyltransferase involved in cell wall biosynthesis
MPDLSVAVDARRLQDHPLTGAGRWIANVLPELTADADLLLVVDQRRPPACLALPQRSLRFPPRLPEVAWFQTQVPRALRSFRGIFHGTFAAIPYALRLPSVVHINDLSFEHHPEDFGRAKRVAFAAQARWAASHAGHVMTISEHARRSIIETYGIAEDGCSVAPPAVDPVFGPRPRAEIAEHLARLHVTGRYVVAIGGARRRGLAVAVAAWRRRPAGQRDVGLVVVGSEAPEREAGVVHVGRLDDADWATVLAGAETLCYPTRFEGFGMPALEAAASGVPVVCAPVGPLPEVLGDAAEWCERPEVGPIAAGLGRLLSDEARRRRLAAAGLAQAAAAPTWANAGALVLAAYRKVSGG